MRGEGGGEVVVVEDEGGLKPRPEVLRWRRGWWGVWGVEWRGLRDRGWASWLGLGLVVVVVVVVAVVGNVTRFPRAFRGLHLGASLRGLSLRVLVRASTSEGVMRIGPCLEWLSCSMDRRRAAVKALPWV